MSLHIIVGFKGPARRGEPSVVYIGDDLVKGLKQAAQVSGEFQSFGRLSNPQWIPAKPRTDAAIPASVKTDQSKQSTKGKL